MVPILPCLVRWHSFARRGTGYSGIALRGIVDLAPAGRVDFGGTVMRLTRRSAASGRLCDSLAGSAALSLGVAVAALSGPALAATTGPALASTSGQHGSAIAVATPSTVTPGTAVTLQVTCGTPQATAATLAGTALGLPAQIPMNSEPSGGGVFTVTVTLPSSIQPGAAHPAIDCSDGSSATASVRVTAMPSSAGAQAGAGTTSAATNASLSAAGLALIAVGAVAGGLALRRRTGTRS
jgi:hypothetical protein